MAPMSGQGVEEAEEEALLSPTKRESVSGHLGPPAGAPAAPEIPTCLPDTTPHPAPVGCSAHPQACCCCRLALESLDPRTLRLLWRQRELEIQALRWAVQNGQDARLCHILEEVAGLPPKRSSHSQEKLLQNQVQKLTLELKEQKERAQWEKEHLEERLLQTTRTLQEVEAELQNLQESCLLQLARSSWVGRMLRSQTGSVEVSLSPSPPAPGCPPRPPPLIGCLCWGALTCLEAWPAQAVSGTLGSSREESGGLKAQVVTAETLMDPSDLSEDIQAPTGEGFRLEDVDWNSIAHRYPNLFTNMEPSSKQKQPRPWPQLDTGSSESSRRHSERHHKTVEWGSLPCLNTSSSGGTDSDSSSCRPGLPSFVQVIGHPPQDHRASSEQALVQARSSSRDSEGAAGLFWPHREHPVGTPFEGPLPKSAALSRSPENPLTRARPAGPVAPALHRPRPLEPGTPAEPDRPEDRGCELPGEVRPHLQRIAGEHGRPERHGAEAAGARLPGAPVPLPAGHAAGPAAPHHGLGRGDPQRQEAPARVLGSGAGSPPLQPRLRDAAPESQGRGPQ
nr:lamin tail domain-containing protein 2 isoform X6 [Symphalangus syndactylus]